MKFKKQHIYATRMVAVMALLAVIAIGVWQANAKDAKPDSTTLILFFFALVLFATVALPTAVLAAVNRISNLDILGVKIELQVQEARNVLEGFPADNDEVKVPPRPLAEDVGTELDLVRAELKRKLRFTRDAVLDDPSSLPETHVAAHLHYMGLFAENEAELCHKLLGEGLGEDIASWDATDSAAFLDTAWRFSWRFATHMFDRYARRKLEDAGWFIADFEQSSKHRADFLGYWDGHWARVAARVGAPRKTVEATARRMRREGAPVETRSVIVVPDHVDHLWEGFGDGPKELAEGEVLVFRIRRLLAEPDLLFPAPEPEPVGETV